MPAGQPVSNSSCLIALAAVKQLDLLGQVFGEVAVPEAVARELRSLSLPAWARAIPVKERTLVEALHTQLGGGEAEAIALAIETGAASLILDDRKARRVARQLGLRLSGTFSVLLLAKERRYLAAVRPVLDSLLAAGFHASDALVAETLRRAGETR